MRFVTVIGARKRGATEPPFFGAITEADDSPTDLTGVLGVEFRLGTPGSAPIISGEVQIDDPTTGEWLFRPTKEQADALPLGEVLCHLIINWSADSVEAVPFDHYIKLEILESL